MVLPEGFSYVSGKGTWHECLDEALQAYREKYGHEPDEAYIDARLFPSKLKLPGFHALPNVLKGQIILTHPGKAHEDEA